MTKQKQLEKKLTESEMESNRFLDAFQAGHIEMENLTARMGALKRSINSIRLELIETDSGLSKEQLLELTAVIEHFSRHLKESQKSLTLESKMKIARMLIKEIQIGADGIEINHIIPVNNQHKSNEIACLRTGRRQQRERQK